MRSIAEEAVFTEELTAHLSTVIRLKGAEAITVKDTFSGQRYPGPIRVSVLFSPLASIVSILIKSPRPVRIGLDFSSDVQIEPGRKVAVLETVRLASDTIEPGQISRPSLPQPAQGAASSYRGNEGADLRGNFPEEPLRSDRVRRHGTHPPPSNPFWWWWCCPLLAQFLCSLAQVEGQVFLGLAEGAQRQGISRKLSGNLFGLARRTYQNKLERLTRRAAKSRAARCDKPFSRTFAPVARSRGAAS